MSSRSAARLERSQEGVWLVFGDGKYPQDQPRVATQLEVRLWVALQQIADDPAAEVLQVPMGLRFAQIAKKALGRV